MKSPKLSNTEIGYGPYISFIEEPKARTRKPRQYRCVIAFEIFDSVYRIAYLVDSFGSGEAASSWCPGYKT